MEREIKYLLGDATLPKCEGNKIIVHVCNDIGGWGKGFVVAISNHWKEPESEYRKWYHSKDNFTLGQAQIVQVEKDTWVANVIGQHKINKDENGKAPIRYEAIADGLKKVADFAIENNASIHMPRIGCGLAGGTWDKIEPILLNKLIERGISTFVYDFK